MILPWKRSLFRKMLKIEKLAEIIYDSYIFFQFFLSSRLEVISILQNAAFFCTMPRGLGLIWYPILCVCINRILLFSRFDRIKFFLYGKFCRRQSATERNEIIFIVDIPVFRKSNYKLKFEYLCEEEH